MAATPIKFITKAVVAAGACVALAAPSYALTFAGVFGPGEAPITMGDLTDSAALFVNQHPGADAPFLDAFILSVSTLSVDVASLVLPSPELPGGIPDLANVTGLALVTLAGDPLAVDTDGSDGFKVVSLLPQAGIYGLIVLGQSGGGNGGYLGVLAAVPVPVPEPAAASMLALGLLTLGRLRKRRQR